MEHIIRLMSKVEMERMFDEEMLQLVPVMNSFDAVVFLKEDVPRSFDGARVSFGRVDVDLETIVYGLIVFEKVWMLNNKVTIKLVEQVMEDPIEYGILYPEASGYTEYDIPMMFRVNQHVNGQSKLLCNALEVVTVIAESELENVSLGVFGSSSQNYNAGSAYHVAAYLLSLMKYESVNIHLYDYFETSQRYELSGVKVESFTTPCTDPSKYNAIIDDTWLPSKSRWNEYDAEITSVKNFEEFPERLQPFFKVGMLKETRKNSYEWDYQYRGSCFFHKRPCYECSYVYYLVNRLLKAIGKRNPETTYLNKLEYVLYSWIFRYKGKRGASFLKNDYHSSMLSTFITLYKAKEVSVDDVFEYNMSERDMKIFRKYQDLPQGVFDPDGPEVRLYSKLAYSKYDRKIRFLSVTKPSSYIDKFLRQHADHDYVVMSPSHITPSRYVENHVAAIEYSPEDPQYLEAYRGMVREKMSRIMLFSKEPCHIPLNMFSVQTPHFASQMSKKPDFYVTIASENPMLVYDCKFDLRDPVTIEKFKEDMQILGVRPGSVEYRRFQRYMNIRVTEMYLERPIVSEKDYINFLSHVHFDKKIEEVYEREGYKEALGQIYEMKKSKMSVEYDPGGLQSVLDAFS